MYLSESIYRLISSWALLVQIVEPIESPPLMMLDIDLFTTIADHVPFGHCTTALTGDKHKLVLLSANNTLTAEGSSLFPIPRGQQPATRTTRDGHTINTTYLDWRLERERTVIGSICLG